MSAGRLDLGWVAPGPVSAGFMRSGAQIVGINGPVGSGKTATALTKGIVKGQQQAPSTRDTARGPGGKAMPVRKFKLCVVRDTYRNLWRSTLPSWWKRIPREVGTFHGTENAPAQHRVNFALSDGTMLDYQIDFVAIGENAAEDVLRGYEPTAFLLNELDMLSEDVFNYARGRTGRYPDMSEGGPTWHGVLFDCNAPELNSWLYRKVFLATPEQREKMKLELFIQPSGLSPAAENLANLPGGAAYYTGQVEGQPEWYVRRMVENKPGYSRAGRPVYPEFVDELHVREFDYAEGLPLLVGLDAGGSPAAVIGQMMPNGQRRVLDELTAEQGTGPTRFGQDLARRFKERFPGARVIRGIADPSAAYGADRKMGERSWIEIVAHEAGIPIIAAPTNKPVERWEAVRLPLTRLIDGQPAFLLHSRCTVLREGFHAGYRFKRFNQQEDRYAEEAEKNEYSHPHDALQYFALEAGGHMDIAGRRDAARAMVRAPVVHDWDPYSLEDAP